MYQLNVNRVYRLILLWGVVWLTARYGLSWFPEHGTAWGKYTITRAAFINALYALMVAKTINVVMRVFIWDYLVAKVLKGLAPNLVIQMTAMFVYFIAIIVIVAIIFGESVAGIITALGAFGVILGFGIQRLVLDAFSGISMNFDAPFGLGDFIQYSAPRGISYVGRVTKMSWRITTLTTNEGYEVAIPNNVLTGHAITNYSRPTPVSEFEQIYYFPTHYNINFVLEILSNALNSVVESGYILSTPEPKVRVSECRSQGLLESSVDQAGYKIKYFLDPTKNGPGKVKHFLHKAVLEHVKGAGFSFSTSDGDLKRDEVSICHDLLRNIPFFEHLTSDEVDTLSNDLIYRQFEEGQKIIEIGDEGQSMFFIQKGYTRILVPDDQKEMRVVSILNPGNYFGEMSLLTGEKRGATVEAGVRTIVYEVQKETLLKILKNNKSLYETFARVMAQRISQTASLQKGDKRHMIKDNFVDTCLLKIQNFFK
jgi:small-conductance mechanosensitive channel